MDVPIESASCALGLTASRKAPERRQPRGERSFATVACGWLVSGLLVTGCAETRSNVPSPAAPPMIGAAEPTNKEPTWEEPRAELADTKSMDPGGDRQRAMTASKLSAASAETAVPRFHAPREHDRGVAPASNDAVSNETFMPEPAGSAAAKESGARPPEPARTESRPGNADLAAKGTWKPSESAAENLQAVRNIIDRCLDYLEQNPKYTVRVSRQEKVGHRVLPVEIMLMHFRLHPRSVYYKWLDENHTGRAVLYVEGQNDGMIISHGGKGDFLLAGRTMRVDPQGFLARSKSRYSITESGLDNMVRRLEAVVALLERGDFSRGTVEFLGEATHEQVEGPLLAVRQHIPVGADPFVPNGGLRHWYFDPATSRLVIMHGDELGGSFLEHYRFDRFVPNPALSDRDFDPAVIFPKKSAEGGWHSPAPSRTAGRAGSLPK